MSSTENWCGRVADTRLHSLLSRLETPALIAENSVSEWAADLLYSCSLEEQREVLDWGPIDGRVGLFHSERVALDAF